MQLVRLCINLIVILVKLTFVRVHKWIMWYCYLNALSVIVTANSIMAGYPNIATCLLIFLETTIIQQFLGDLSPNQKFLWNIPVEYLIYI